MAIKVNIGCGDYALPGFVNIDENPAVIADLHVHIPPLPFENGTVDEIVAIHFLEHLQYVEALLFMAECWRTLRVGGIIYIVVPDTKEIMKRWLAQTNDAIEYPYGVWWKMNNLDHICAAFLYSTVQPSPHRWSYCKETLGVLYKNSGFQVVGEMDRYTSPLISQGGWYQIGLRGVKMGTNACARCQCALNDSDGPLCLDCGGAVIKEAEQRGIDVEWVKKGKEDGRGREDGDRTDSGTDGSATKDGEGDAHPSDPTIRD